MNKVLAFLVLYLCTVPVFSDSEADHILRQMELSLNPSVYHGIFKMQTHYPDRPDPAPMRFETWYKEGKGSFMVVLDPARSRGLRFLQKDGNLWMYNPVAGSKRPVRLSGRTSFQGSLFSNHDVSDPQYTDEYDAHIRETTIIKHPELGAIRGLVLEAIARTPAAAYGKIIVTLTETEHIPYELEYYAHSGFLLKKLTLTRVQDLAGKNRPTFYRMDSFEQEGAFSLIEIEKLEALDSLDDTKFSQSEFTK
jgi:hypothetical protein